MSTNAPNYTPATLGDSEVWIKRTPKGDITAVKAVLTLREASSEIAVIEGKPMITADGYYRANQIASLAIITPDSIMVPQQDGDMQAVRVPNPFPVIDVASGTQKGVYAKKTVVGYSPTGTLAVSSHTMFYNFTTYFLADLQKKIQYDASAGKVCFKGQLTEDEMKHGIFMPVEGEFGIYANMAHKEILKCVGTWLQNKNFGERKAQTIAERNAMKRHPALSIKLQNFGGPDKQRVGQVLVIGWQHDLTRHQLENIAQAAEAGEEVVVGDQKAEVYDTTGSVSEEDVVASTEIDEEMARASEMAEEFGGPDDGGTLF